MKVLKTLSIVVVALFLGTSIASAAGASSEDYSHASSHMTGTPSVFVGR